MTTANLTAAFDANTANGWTPATYRIRRTPAGMFTFQWYTVEKLTAMVNGVPEWTQLLMHRTEQAARKHVASDAASYGRTATLV